MFRYIPIVFSLSQAARIILDSIDSIDECATYELPMAQ